MSENVDLDLGIRKELESNFKTYKNSFVPLCPNTSVKTPEKIFLTVPASKAKRKLWFEAIGDPERKKLNQTIALKNDLKNYLPWLTEGEKKMLKAQVVPHINLKSNTAPTPTVLGHTLCPGTSQTSTVVAYENLEADTAPATTEESSSFEYSDCSTQSIQACDVDVSFRNVKSQERSNQHEIEYMNEYTDTSGLIKVYSKSVQANPKVSSVEVQCSFLQPHGEPYDLTSAIKKLTVSEDLDGTFDSLPSEILDTGSSYEPSRDETSSKSVERKLHLRLLKDNIFEKYTKFIIEEDPLAFLGVHKQSMFVLDLLSKASSVSVRDIYLVLKKMKTNLPFSILATEFSVSCAQAGKIFTKIVAIISKFLEKFIVWPSAKDILLNLPIPFRYRYFNVQSIIDCFEIEIEKPSNAVHQALSWSDYKKCNTDKYLISITGDGLVDFVSDGVGGRCSDMAIVENCGYLEKLPPNSSVLADRGFKQLDTLLRKKQCNLIRPPSVMQNVKSSKHEVQATKQIASLRIHVERVINRIRNFQILDIHSRVDNHLIPHLDSMVKIACGLVNLQTSIIKQTEM